MHGVVCLCVDLLFVCEMAVGNVLCCAVMVGVYVHALAIVDARVRYLCGVLAVRAVHWCDDASGVWLAFVGALVLHRAGITRRRWAVVVCKCGGSCVCLGFGCACDGCMLWFGCVYIWLFCV